MNLENFVRIAEGIRPYAPWMFLFRKVLKFTVLKAHTPIPALIKVKFDQGESTYGAKTSKSTSELAYRNTASDLRAILPVKIHQIN